MTTMSQTRRFGTTLVGKSRAPFILEEPTGERWEIVDVEGVGGALVARRTPSEQGEHGLRPSVLHFAIAMEERLRAHDAERGERGWMGESSGRLLGRLRDEVEELDAALDIPWQEFPPAMRYRDEAADVGNFAMMIADSTGALLGIEERLKRAREKTRSPTREEPGEPQPYVVQSGVSWLVVEPGSSLKRCPDCGTTALEGEATCTNCGMEPSDDLSWRAAGGLPADPNWRAPREPQGDGEAPTMTSLMISPEAIAEMDMEGCQLTGESEALEEAIDILRDCRRELAWCVHGMGKRGGEYEATLGRVSDFLRSHLSGYSRGRETSDGKTRACTRCGDLLSHVGPDYWTCTNVSCPSQRECEDATPDTEEGS